MTDSKIAGFHRTQLLAPLVIGVTGHRDLREEDRQGLEQQVKQIFLKLREDYPATPLVLLSPIAEGADRLVAKTALALNAGIRLIVPLPFPIDLYESDFDHPSGQGHWSGHASSRGEFRALLEKAEASFVLPLAEGNDLQNFARKGPQRDRQYELAGKYIAQQCQILIALWDGQESEFVGGTSSVVHFQSDGIPGPEICDLEVPEGFPVYHILTPRLKDPYPQGQSLQLRYIYPAVFKGNNELAQKYYDKMFSRLDEFNRYITGSDKALAKEAQKGKGYLLQDAREDHLPPGLGTTLMRYAVTDALAIRFQQRLFWAQIALHTCTFLAFFCFLLFVHAEHHLMRFMFASWGLIAGVILIRMLAGKFALDTQHEDYRAMAEGLRVKFFWKLAGITDAVADHYLGKQRSELDWIRNGFRGWNVTETLPARALAESQKGEAPADLLRFARKYWIDDQQQYFHRAAERDTEKRERIELAGKCFMGVVLVLSFVLAGLAYFGGDEAQINWAAIALESFLALAALVHHFGNRMAYDEHAKQYQRMDALFANGSKLLGQFLDHNDLENARRCLQKIGNEALTENGDWVFLRRERPIEVPHP